MKFYETHFEDYCNSVDKYNMHEELIPLINSFPKNIRELSNMIVYGPTGVGKYSQTLSILKKYSPSQLKYDKKITVINEKQNYTYRISDIHYEIDMSLLGCNSKIMWHECFQQIVDIVSVKPDKHGIIVCKNFHVIHNELLDIFYSYMQQYSYNKQGGTEKQEVQIKFILITEHLSFLPMNIINHCLVLSVKRPSREVLLRGITGDKGEEHIRPILDNILPEHIINNKEIHSFALIKTTEELPQDNFNIICDTIIKEMIRFRDGKHKRLENGTQVANFRDCLYDILIYGLDAVECVWYIFSFFAKNKYFPCSAFPIILEKISLFLKQYGNNYRAIFHIENVFFMMIQQLS